LIRNLSETQPLRNVHVELVNVEIEVDGNFVSAGFGERLHLAWSKADDLDRRHQPRDIPPLGEYYANVVSVDEEHNRVWVKSKQQWQTDQHLFLSPCVYRLTVAVSPMEGARKSILLRMRWTGRWNETQMWTDAQ
jgi:hypothetical protein